MAYYKKILPTTLNLVDCDADPRLFVAVHLYSPASLCAISCINKFPFDNFCILPVDCSPKSAPFLDQDISAFGMASGLHLSDTLPFRAANV